MSAAALRSQLIVVLLLVATLRNAVIALRRVSTSAVINAIRVYQEGAQQGVRGRQYPFAFAIFGGKGSSPLPAYTPALRHLFLRGLVLHAPTSCSPSCCTCPGLSI